MADNLPEPMSRKESYLAKAAGMDTAIPEPESREELYLKAIADNGGGGGGGSYTAGDGIDITNNKISVDTTTIQPKLTAGSGIAISAENVISAAAGGITTLTEADYNWPVSNPNGVAMWLLPAGWYNKEAPSVAIYYDNASRDASNANTVYVSHTVTDASGTNEYKLMFSLYGSDPKIHYEEVHLPEGGNVLPGNQYLLYVKGNANNLTTTQAGYTLDARQGKALNEKITPTTGSGAPTTSTTGTVGKIYIDTDNNTAYMCVSDTGGTYTWKAITA